MFTIHHTYVKREVGFYLLLLLLLLSLLSLTFCLSIEQDVDVYKE